MLRLELTDIYLASLKKTKAACRTVFVGSGFSRMATRELNRAEHVSAAHGRKARRVATSKEKCNFFF